MGKMSTYLQEELGLLRARYTEGNYTTQLLCMYKSMFAWTAPDFFDPAWAERYLAFSGNFVAGNLPDGSPAIAPNVSRVGALDIYGDGTDANAPCRGTAGTITGELGSTAFICYNNSMRMPETDLIYYPDVLATIDRSVYTLVDWSKYPPLIRATDSKVETALNSILQDLDDGKPRAVVSNNLLESMSRGYQQDVYSVDITNPQKIQLIQYLLEAHDVIMRRIMAKNGIDTRRTSKHAQVSVDEADGMQLASWVYPLNKLEQRQFFADAWTAAYPDYPISVDFAEPWSSAYKEFLAEQQLPAAELDNAGEEGGDNAGNDQDDSSDDT